MSRSTAKLAALSAGLVLATAGSASAQIPVPEGGTPSVDMEAVVLAAQLDPHRASGATTAGSADDVVKVQQRLQAKGVLPKGKGYRDGSFGPSTKAAYAKWQNKLGYTGLGANGLPGPTSLKRLLGKRFGLFNVINVGKKTTYDGKTVNLRTKKMMVAASRLVGKGCQIGLTQGSYNPGGVGASQGTHDGGGAIDVNLGEICGKKRVRVVRALRTVGFAAWYRPTIKGLWNQHIHGIAISDTDLASGAQNQVWDYFTGHDGLAGNGPDLGPKVGFRTFEQFKRSR